MLGINEALLELLAYEFSDVENITASVIFGVEYGSLCEQVHIPSVSLRRRGNYCLVVFLFQEDSA